MAKIGGERTTLTLGVLRERVGTEVGVSRWIAVDQAMIDGFAALTDDHQFIHVDPARARAETPFSGTIAHGFLTLSLLSRMAYDVMPKVDGAAMGINYGFDRIRFLAPVPSGSKIRGRFRLAGLDERRPGELTSTYEVQVEIEGQEKPALAANWLTRAYVGDEPRG